MHVQNLAAVSSRHPGFLCLRSRIVGHEKGKESQQDVSKHACATLSAAMWTLHKLSIQAQVKNISEVLDVEHEYDRVFDCRLDFLEECDRFPAINQPMVVGQTDVHHGPDLHLPINCHGSLKNGMHPKDG